MSHKFVLGQAVMFTPTRGDIIATAMTGKITRLLPKENAEYQYHVQFGPDGQERRVQELQLRPVVGPNPPNFVRFTKRKPDPRG